MCAINMERLFTFPATWLVAYPELNVEVIEQ